MRLPAAPTNYERSFIDQAFSQVTRTVRGLQQIDADYIIPLDKRLILQSPNGQYWQVSVDNAGALTTTAVSL